MHDVLMSLPGNGTLGNNMSLVEISIDSSIISDAQKLVADEFCPKLLFAFLLDHPMILEVMSVATSLHIIRVGGSF